MPVSGSDHPDQSVLTRALHLDQRRLPDTGPCDPLPAGGALLFREWTDPDWLTGLGRRIERFDDLHILHSFFTRWLWRSIVEDAIRKIQQFRCKLVALAKLLAVVFPSIVSVYPRPSAYS